MVDICKCNQEDCTLKNSCYRYTSSADPIYQAYFADVMPGGKDCEYFIADRSVKQPDVEKN